MYYLCAQLDDLAGCDSEHGRGPEINDYMRNLLIAALAVLLCSCGGERRQKDDVHSVFVTQPEVGGETSVREFAAMVREARAVSLGFKTPGQIARIYVKEGARVHSGQLLAELDDADYRLGVEAAQVQYEQLEGEVARLTRLHDDKSLSDNDFEKAKAGLRQLEVQLQANRNKLAYTKLYAPADGVVAEVKFDEAEMVDAGTPLFSLLDVSQMEVEADLTAAEYLQRDELADFVCTTAYTGGDEFALRLVSIVPKADNSQLYRMRLAFVSAADSRLTSGMNAVVKARTTSPAAGGKMTLPLRAVFGDGGESCVWVVGDDATVVRRAVTVDGIDDRGRAVIAAGLDGSECVVSAGVGALHEGDRVRVIEQPSRTNVGGLL